MRKYTEPDGIVQGFRFKKGLLLFNEENFIPDCHSFRSSILQEHHVTPSAGHSGVKATSARLANSFSWQGLHLDVKKFVKLYTVCQHNKYVTHKKKGLLQPLPTPNKVWEDLTMDFIMQLPNSFGHTVIWVICDRLSKYVHFIALPSHFIAKDLVTRFVVEIFCLHGSPNSIVSD